MLVLLKLQCTLDKSKVKNLVVLLQCILRLVSVVLISVFFLCKKNIIKQILVYASPMLQQLCCGFSRASMWKFCLCLGAISDQKPYRSQLQN